MGLIRGFLLVIVSVLLFLSIISASLLWTVSSSLNYENVEKQSSVILKDLIGNTVNLSATVSQYLPLVQIYCQNHSNLSYVFNAEGYTFEISCATIMQPPSKVIDEGIKSVIKKFYYQEYACGFFDCLKPGEPPLFLISAKAKNYWETKFYFFLTISVILAGAIFFLVEKKTNWPIIVGGFLFMAFLVFFKLSDLLILFPDKMLSQFISIFFSESFAVSIKLLIGAIVLLIIGVILKLFKIGFFIEKTAKNFEKAHAEKFEKKKEEKSPSKKSK